MLIKIKFVLLVLVLISTSGCTFTGRVNKTLSPPQDTKWINIEVKNPSPYTKPFPLEVRYISYKCKKSRISGFDGSVITEPSYNVIGLYMQQGEEDTWKAKVAMTGGGSCKWTLSAITLGIEYTDATHLGKDLVLGSAVDATIAFDSDAARNGQYKMIYGDVVLSPKYYPYITEWKVLRNENELSFLGDEDFILYRAMDAGRILFTPSLDERKVVKYIEPEKKVEGSHSKIIYPDGSVVSDGTVFPSFDKVDKIKVN